MFKKIAPTTVDRVADITEEEFLTNYKNKSKPVILSNLTHDWPAKKKWSIDFLIDTIGDEVVPVYSSKPATEKQHQHGAAAYLSIREYLTMLKAGENDLRMFFYNILKNAPSLTHDFNYPKLGLRFVKKLPVMFVGGRGAKVQMHYDIDLADLVLCHFGGIKHVLLVPPEQTPYMYKVPFSFSSLFDVNFSTPDFNKYPALKKVQGMSAELHHGDALFIPSGYWHYIIYQDIGFSLTLRSFPTTLKQRMIMAKNIALTRTIEGTMRKLVGQAWNKRNERKAVENTHRYFNDIK
jgi:hypothetical protein